MGRNIELEPARALLLESLVPLECEVISLDNSLGRFLAENLVAEEDCPPHSLAALSGYGVRSTDLGGARSGHPVRLMLTHGTSFTAGQAIPVAAGARLPSGCDAVLPLGDAQMDGDGLSALRALWPFDHFVRRGEDYHAGDLLLPAGTRLTAPAVALLSGLGRARCRVLRRPVVTLCETGAAPEWAVLLRARLKELGAEVTNDPACADLLLTGPGTALPDLVPIFSGVRAEPCGTTELGLWHGKPILCLPGAPADADVTFTLFVRPAISALTGDETLLPQSSTAILGTAFPRSTPLRRFFPAALTAGGVTLPEGRSPLSLALLARCNALVEIPSGSDPLMAGETVLVVCG